MNIFFVYRLTLAVYCKKVVPGHPTCCYPPAIEIVFLTDELADDCNIEQRRRRRWGAAAEPLLHRLYLLDAVDDFADLPFGCCTAVNGTDKYLVHVINELHLVVTTIPAGPHRPTSNQYKPHSRLALVLEVTNV